MVEGAIEVSAKMFRRQGRWVLALQIPPWVAEEAVPEIQSKAKGLVATVNGTAMLLAVVSGAGAQAPVPEPPRRPMQVMPDGIAPPGKPLVHPEPPKSTRSRMISPSDPAEAAMCDYIRTCVEESRPVDFAQVRAETHLGPTQAKRFIQRLITEHLDRKYITAAQANALIVEKLHHHRQGQPLARDADGKVVRKGISKPPCSEEAKAKMRAHWARKRAEKAAAAGGQASV